MACKNFKQTHKDLFNQLMVGRATQDEKSASASGASGSGAAATGLTPGVPLVVVGSTMYPLAGAPGVDGVLGGPIGICDLPFAVATPISLADASAEQPFDEPAARQPASNQAPLPPPPPLHPPLPVPPSEPLDDVLDFDEYIDEGTGYAAGHAVGHAEGYAEGHAVATATEAKVRADAEARLAIVEARAKAAEATAATLQEEHALMMHKLAAFIKATEAEPKADAAPRPRLPSAPTGALPTAAAAASSSREEGNGGNSDSDSDPVSDPDFVPDPDRVAEQPAAPRNHPQRTAAPAGSSSFMPEIPGRDSISAGPMAGGRGHARTE